MALTYLLCHIVVWLGLYLIVTLSLNLEYGYCGIPNFGKALSVLSGALAVGALMNRILIFIFRVEGNIIEASGAVGGIVTELIQKNFILGIALLIASLVMAGVIGALAGFVSILPCARLGGYYLAITMFAISEIMYIVSHHTTEIAGGYYGVRVPGVLAWIPGTYRIIGFTILIFLVALGVLFLMNKVANSPYGRMLKAIRESEDVVEAYGGNITMVRLKTVTFGSGIAAIAGALYSLYAMNTIASTFGRIEWTFYPFLIVLMGGKGNNWGTVAGTLTFVVTRAILSIYKHEIRMLLGLPFETVWLEYILFGVLMLIILNYRPEGIIREKSMVETEPIKSKLKSLPQRRRVA